VCGGGGGGHSFLRLYSLVPLHGEPWAVLTFYSKHWLKLILGLGCCANPVPLLRFCKPLRRTISSMHLEQKQLFSKLVATWNVHSMVDVTGPIETREEKIERFYRLYTQNPTN